MEIKNETTKKLYHSTSDNLCDEMTKHNLQMRLITIIPKWNQEQWNYSNSRYSNCQSKWQEVSEETSENTENNNDSSNTNTDKY